MQSLTDHCIDCHETPTTEIRDHLLSEMFPIETGLGVWMDDELRLNRLCTHAICISETDFRNGAWMRFSGWNPCAVAAINTQRFLGVKFYVCPHIETGHVILHLCEVMEYEERKHHEFDKSKSSG